MYGYLIWTQNGGLDAAMPQWLGHLLQPKGSAAQVKLAEDNARKAFAKACPSQDPLSKQLNPQSMLALFSRVEPGLLSFGMAVWLAHHRLQPLELKVRTVTLEALVSDQLSDLDLTADLQRMQDDMKAMATLIPDATLAMDIRKYTAQMLLNMLQQHSVFAKTLNAPLSQILFSLPPGLKPQQPIIQAVLWDVVCSRPAGQRAAALAPFRALIAQGKGRLLLDAPKRCAARLKFMLPAPLFYDALCLMVKEAIEPDARPLDEIIDTHSDQAGDLYNTALNAARRATMEAVAAGVNLGDKTTSSGEALLAFYRDRELSNRMRTRNTLQLARSRKNTAPGQQTEQEKAQTAVIQAWSLQQVAQWIEGPIAPPKAKPVPIDRKAILQAQQKPTGSSAKTPKAPQKAPPDALTAADVDQAIREALSATASFLLGEISDLLAPAKLLQADLQLITHCTQLQPALQEVADGRKNLQEDATIALLGQAEEAVIQLREGIKSAASSAKLQQDFRNALTVALHAEPLELGKRHGGQVAFRAQVEDWSFVSENFHNRWLPHVKDILVNGAPTLLAPNQAVALYVTGSSLSGYAFDVSVHLWQRYRTSQSKPSTESGPLPPMNTAEWFDTRTTCCVLHIPAK